MSSQQQGDIPTAPILITSFRRGQSDVDLAMARYSEGDGLLNEWQFAAIVSKLTNIPTFGHGYDSKGRPIATEIDYPPSTGSRDGQYERHLSYANPYVIAKRNSRWTGVLGVTDMRSLVTRIENDGLRMLCLNALATNGVPPDPQGAEPSYRKAAAQKLANTLNAPEEKSITPESPDRHETESAVDKFFAGI